MAELALTFGPRGLSVDGPERIELLAELFPVGGRRRGGEMRSAAIMSGETSVIGDLAAGLWQVRVTAPSGVRIVKDVALNDGDRGELDFDDDLGIASTDVAGWRPDGRRGGRDGRVRSMAPWSVGSVRRMPDPPQVSIVELMSGEDDVFGGQWALVGELIGRRARLVGTRVRVVRNPSNADETLVDDPRLRDAGGRSVMVVSLGSNSMLQSVPLTWDVFEGGNDVEVRLSVASGLPGCEIVIADPSIAGVIAYLGAGSLSAAAGLIASSRELDFVDMLRGKLSAPLRACAAAYAILGSSDLSRPAEWHEWLGNLAGWFERIPDGPIIYARFLQLTGRRDRVPALVREALRRGVPHYTLGVAWLSELMSYYPDDAFIQGHRRLVNKVAAHVDVSTPFTCLRWRNAG